VDYEAPQRPPYSTLTLLAVYVSCFETGWVGMKLVLLPTYHRITAGVQGGIATSGVTKRLYVCASCYFTNIASLVCWQDLLGISVRHSVLKFQNVGLLLSSHPHVLLVACFKLIKCCGAGLWSHTQTLGIEGWHLIPISHLQWFTPPATLSNYEVSPISFRWAKFIIMFCSSNNSAGRSANTRVLRYHGLSHVVHTVQS